MDKKAMALKAPYVFWEDSELSCKGWNVGDVLRVPDDLLEREDYPEFIRVMAVRDRFAEDDEDGEMYSSTEDIESVYFARCRAATMREITSFLKADKNAESERTRPKRRLALMNEFREKGTSSSISDCYAKGKKIAIKKEDGSWKKDEWFVIGAERIWYVEYCGEDPEHYPISRVVGDTSQWHLPFSDELENRVREVCGKRRRTRK